MDNILIEALIELKLEFDKADINLIIGGGFGIYLRKTFINDKRQQRYKKSVEVRTTNDIDIFFTNELIKNEYKIKYIKKLLQNLNYRPSVKFMQYKKLFNNMEVKIDFLSAPPDSENFDKFKIKEPRIRLKTVNDFHAYLTYEARGIILNLVPIDLTKIKKGMSLKKGNLFVPSRFNYIILKLHAFKDRVNDKKSEFGRHHAYDIFVNIVDMTDLDWRDARKHFNKESKNQYIINSINIRKKYFSTEEAIGILRIKENISYQQDKEYFEHNDYIAKFIDDLKELLPDN